jgi:hypothetical protein
VYAHIHGIIKVDYKKNRHILSLLDNDVSTNNTCLPLINAKSL